MKVGESSAVDAKYREQEVVQGVVSQMSAKVLVDGWDVVQARNLDLVRLLSAVERSHRLWNYSVRHNRWLVHQSAEYKAAAREANDEDAMKSTNKVKDE